MYNLKLILFVFLFVGICVLVFYNYFYVGAFKDRIFLIKNTKEITQTYQETIPINKLFDIYSRKNITIAGNPNGEGLTFIWNMYLPNYIPERIWFTSYSKDKPILRIGDSPQILFNPKMQSLKILVKFKFTQFNNHYPIIELKDIPLQKWNKYIVIIKTNDIQIYINGEIKVHKKIPNPIIINNQDIELGEVNNNIIGSISDFEIIFRPLNNIEVINEF
jgi:hypothetical protein